MGAMTLAQLVNSVFSRIDEATASTNAVTLKQRPEVIRVVDDLNDAYSDIYKKLYGTLGPQSFDVITTQAGVPTYAVASDTTAALVMLVGILNGSNYAPLPQSNIEELSRIYGNLNTQGAPLYWYKYQNTIGFYPCPNTAFQVRVVARKAFVRLDTGSDTTILPDEYDTLLVHYSIGTQKLFWKDPDATFWLQRYKDGMNELRAKAIREGPTRFWATDLGDGEWAPADSWLTLNSVPGA